MRRPSSSRGFFAVVAACVAVAATAQTPAKPPRAGETTPLTVVLEPKAPK
jgi:hypothetical protein